MLEQARAELEYAHGIFFTHSDWHLLDVTNSDPRRPPPLCTHPRRT
jgi:hypothetical protein